MGESRERLILRFYSRARVLRTIAKIRTVVQYSFDSLHPGAQAELGEKEHHSRLSLLNKEGKTIVHRC